MRVLVTGLDQSNFLIQLYSGIKRRRSGMYLAATSLRQHGNTNSPVTQTAFDNVYDAKKTAAYYKLYALLQLFFSRWFISILLYIIFVSGKFKKALHFCFVAAKEKAFFIANNNFTQYDVFHFHYMQYSYIRGIWMVPKGKKIICSFWGSDLLRTADSFNHFVVKKALEKATIITVQSNELKELVLVKYGLELKDKIRVVLFSLDEDIFMQIDSCRGNQALIQGFCQANNISADKVKVTIGHNASDFNNHLAIINALGMLPVKNNVFAIVPFAYGIAPKSRAAYKKQLEEALQNAGIPFTILDNFYSGANLAMLRLVSNVMVHMPQTDALSAALVETAYAGNVIITGDWLPYSPFKKAALAIDYTDFDKLPAVLDKAISNYAAMQATAATINIPAVQEYFFPSKTVEGWLGIFDELAAP